MPDATDAAGLASHPDPQQDRPGKPVPANIAQILQIVRILLGYGRHLARTLEHRAAVRGFSVIAQCFGTANVAVILAHLCRGIRRAIALERVLLARAARGRDLAILQPRARTSRTVPPAAPAATQQAAPSQPEAPAAAPLRIRRAEQEEPLDLAHLPTMERSKPKPAGARSAESLPISAAISAFRRACAPAASGTKSSRP